MGEDGTPELLNSEKKLPRTHSDDGIFILSSDKNNPSQNSSQVSMAINAVHDKNSHVCCIYWFLTVLFLVSDAESTGKRGS